MAAITGPGTYTLPEPFDFDAIDAKTAKELGRLFYGDKNILLTCEKPVGVQAVSVVLFEENGSFSCDMIDTLTTEKSLVPNPWHLVAFGKMQPDFADERAIATQWKDADGRFCYAIFGRYYDGRRNINVDRYDGGWDDRYLFSGSSK